MTIPIHTRENSPTSASPAGGVHGDESAAVCCAADSISVSNQCSPICGDAINAESVETCDDGPKLAASESSAGETKGVISGAEKSPRSKRGGSRAVVAHSRDRAAEKEQRRLRYSLALPQCGRAVESITRRVKEFRRALEAAVIAARGEISLADACAVNSACAAERHLSLCASWLKRDEKTLTPGERLAHAKGMLEGSEKRDRAVASLRLPGGATEAAGSSPSDFYALLNKQVDSPAVEQQAEKSTSAAAPQEQPDCPAPPAPPPPAAEAISAEDL